ncbi:MAG TPA: heme o synthase [Hyphomicrobiales bacterium]|nr:heme o synthase [Hyphomicrobiales bacterium]
MSLIDAESLSPTERTDAAAIATVADYVALLKPRVMSLVVFTALTGMAVAPGHIHPVLGLVAILSIAIGAGASGALNMWYDADIDRVMTRTRGRPVPAGRVAPEEALGFGLFLSVASVVVLGLAVNWAAASLLAFTIFFYVVVYTIGLKRRTPQNIVIGGAAGAFPPVVGWLAVTGAPSLDACLLFAIIFIWTPPHFWALALYKSGDYARAGVPMLPVVAGRETTRRHILGYSLVLVPLALAPVATGLAGPVYGVVAGIAGAIFLGLAVTLARVADAEADAAARRLFAFSILYLFLLFATLLAESGIGLVR